MFTTPLNEKTVTVKIRRIDLCDLMLACTALDASTDENTIKWAKLHDRLKEILVDFDCMQQAKCAEKESEEKLW